MDTVGGTVGRVSVWPQADSSRDVRISNAMAFKSDMDFAGIFKCASSQESAQTL
jgi:hypothetical protein